MGLAKWIGLVQFRRTEHSEKENGIGIGSSPTDLDIILDNDMKVVKDMWQYWSSTDNVFGYIMTPEGIYIDLTTPIPQKQSVKMEKSS